MEVIFVNSLPISLLNAAIGVATHNNIIKQLHCRYQLDIDCILMAQARCWHSSEIELLGF